MASAIARAFAGCTVRCSSQSQRINPSGAATSLYVGLGVTPDRRQSEIRQHLPLYRGYNARGTSRESPHLENCSEFNFCPTLKRLPPVSTSSSRTTTRHVVCWRDYSVE